MKEPNISADRFYSAKEIIVENGGILSMSLSAVYSALRSGEIPYKQFGKRKLIPGKFLLKCLEEEY